jgi:hypothetical protein
MVSRNGSARSAALALVAAVALMLLMATGAAANAQSNNIALVPGPAGQAGNGGDLPTSNFPNGYAPSFTNVAIADIDDGTIANPLDGFDTVVLAQVCDIGTHLSDSDFKSRIEGFVQNGGKLLVWDSECQGTDYSNFVFPFTTDNPGPGGAGGQLTDLEDNSLGSTNASSPFFIDYGLITSETDAVADANVFTSFDQHFCADLQSTNADSTVGPMQVYAPFGSGLIIYEGLDYDALSDGQGFDGGSGSGTQNLGRIWLFNLLQGWNPQPASLPCSRKVFGLTLSPKTSEGVTGTDHTVTAHLATNSAPEPNSPVTFTVTDGPNKGVGGTVNTDSNGNASFTYRGNGPAGTDTIQASGTLQSSPPPSNTVEVTQASGETVTVTDTATRTWTAAAVVPAAQACQDVRKFKFLLHHGPRSKVVKAKVFVDGKAVKTRKGSNLKSITISVLPQQNWTVRIVSTHSNGSQLISTRHYKQCTKTKPKTKAKKARRAHK